MMDKNEIRTNSFEHTSAELEGVVETTAGDYEPSHAPVWRKARRGKKQLKVGIAMMLVCAVISCAVGSGITALTFGKYATGQNSVAAAAPNVSTGMNVVRTVSTGQTLSFAEIAAKVSPTVVSITTSTTQNFRFGPSATSTGSGSGIIITENGYIVTNNHVISGASKISVKLPTGTEYAATVVGADSQSDLAVLKVDATNLPYAALGDSDKLAVGDIAVAIGNPLGELSNTVTQGIISATDREITIDDETMSLLQTDAAINPGNSGGALCNAYGEVIGVVNAKTSALGIEGLGFAIPINDAKPVIEELVAKGYVSGRATMNMSVQEIAGRNAGYSRITAGLYAAQVTEDGAAHKAGIQNGDRILSADGKSISTSAELKAVLESHSPGDVIKVVIERQGTQLTISVSLGELNA